MTRHPWVEQLLDQMTVEERRGWLQFLQDAEVKEFTRNGKRIIRIEHLPSKLRVEQIRGADWQESYAKAFALLIDTAKRQQGESA